MSDYLTLIEDVVAPAALYPAVPARGAAAGPLLRHVFRQTRPGSTEFSPSHRRQDTARSERGAVGQTSLEPKEIMTDTAGASDVIFGLFWLLGYQFSPRLADVGGARFWRLDPKADYGALNAVLRDGFAMANAARSANAIATVRRSSSPPSGL